VEDAQELEPQAPCHRQGGVDPGRVVTSLRRSEAGATHICGFFHEAWASAFLKGLGASGLRISESSFATRLYEDIYCARGDMENRIKECQLDLYADRTSAATMRPNQLRLYFASMAYVLLCALRIGLAETIFADATCGSIRLKLLKIGALVHISVRRIKVAMVSACPAAVEWGLAARRLSQAAKARAAPV